jgi:diguanylate cyclase (GGDEF)-like protein/PAS domain S-box-containing protein
MFSVFLLKEHKDFYGFLFLWTGGLFLIISTFLARNDHLLYYIGLNYNFVTFVEMFLLLVASVFWVNAAAELYSHRAANRESLGLYIAVGLTVCVYYSFLLHNENMANHIGTIIVNTCLSLLFGCSVLRVMRDKSLGNFLLCLTVVLLLLKSLSFSFLPHMVEKLNILQWAWFYAYIFAVIFIKQKQQTLDLQKSWNTIDMLNLQINNMVDSSPFPIIIAKITGDKLLLVNNTAAQVFGISKKEVPFHKLKDFFVDETNRLNFFSLLEKEHVVRDYDLMVCDLINASPFWLSVSAKTIEYNNEMAIYMAFQDVTSRKERESNLQSQADKDPLTMAWNRRYFEKLVPECIKECIKKAQNFSLLLLDADKFKNINDTYGHKFGDKVLIELATICRNSLREDDVVARFGGEEFVVFLNNTDGESALKVAERLRQTIADANISDDNGNIIQFTVSIGVVSSEKTASLDILLRQVDDAMYLAKERGRNLVAMYDEQAVQKILNKKIKSEDRQIHPIFQNEENEEISLLDSYENKIL